MWSPEPISMTDDPTRPNLNQRHSWNRGDATRTSHQNGHGPSPLFQPGRRQTADGQGLSQGLGIRPFQAFSQEQAPEAISSSRNRPLTPVTAFPLAASEEATSLSLLVPSLMRKPSGMTVKELRAWKDEKNRGIDKFCLN